ncbi:hypothetical protein Tco_0172863 [Tanacetum coccineum]
MFPCIHACTACALGIDLGRRVQPVGAVSFRPRQQGLQGTTSKAVVQSDLTYLPERLRKGSRFLIDGIARHRPLLKLLCMVLWSTFSVSITE